MVIININDGCINEIKIEGKPIDICADVCCIVEAVSLVIGMKASADTKERIRIRNKMRDSIINALRRASDDNDEELIREFFK